MHLSELARACGGRLLGADAAFCGASNDTRRLQAGQLFVAFSGAHADGHAYVEAAQQGGAAAALVERELAIDLPQVVVPATLPALQRAAMAWRQRFTGPLLALTGSNGKTTTKEMLAAILRAHYGDAVLATAGNLNNHIGVPLTLLGLRLSGAGAHAAAVIEMGASHAGEIAALAAMARPQIAAITLAGAAHLEGFGSVAGVAHAKGELFAALPATGCAVINADDDYAELWRELARHCRQLSFGLEQQADVRADQLQLRDDGSQLRLVTPAGSAELQLAMPGRHNVMNALTATAAALAAQIPLPAVVRGLESVREVGGRLRSRAAKAGAQVVDDSYNANPTSFAAALAWLASVPGERWLVLGDMAELGPEAEHWHGQVGEMARAAGVSRVLALGPLSTATTTHFGQGAQHFDAMEALLQTLDTELHAGVTVLVKGSRSMRMERVVQAIEVADGSHTSVGPAAGRAH